METLKELGKATLKEPNTREYLNDDIAVVVSSHQKFLVAVAPHTKRLNAVSVALMARDVVQLGKREAQLFGDSIAHAYAHCMLVGSKARTGVKLTKEVLAVYQASCAHGEIKQEMKEEASSAAKAPKRPATTKLEQSCSPPRMKSVKKCLSSPSQIAALYGCSSSSSVKVMLFVDMKNTNTQDA